MDALDFAWQAPRSRSSNGVFQQSKTEHQNPVNLRNANKPFQNSRFRHNIGSNSMYKKDKCRNYWFRGRCDYGDNCTFAHGAEEMNNSDIKNYPGKKTCWYSRKDCPYGEKCIFLHEPFKQHEENRDHLCRENTVISIDRIGGNVESKNKTRLCHRWMVVNSCNKGSNCTYAHGQAELRRTTPVLAPKSEDAQTAPMVAVKDTLPNEAQKPNASNKQMLAPKVCLFKWNKIKIKKVVTIYADWIDEESLMPRLATED